MLSNDMIDIFSSVIIAVFSVFLLRLFFGIFLQKKRLKHAQHLRFVIFFIWQFGILRENLLPVYINIGVTIVVTLLTVAFIYKGKFWYKCIFVISFNAIWMLMETLCGFILMHYFDNYLSLQFLGSVASKMLFLFIILVLKIIFTDDEIRELPSNYSVVLLFLPIGSIYIIYSLFIFSSKLSYENGNISSLLASLILLLINILIVSIYLKLADDLHLRRCNSVYEQQLELCERHQQEIELSILQVRDIKHNMKNNLIMILAYVENGDYQQATQFINGIIESNVMSPITTANTGNIVIDSLINYWSTVAEKYGIDFITEFHIPMQMPFKGADLCLILGNALENAVEAAKFSKHIKCIQIRIKYDKENLILAVKNSFDGHVKRDKGGKLLTTKIDTENHGIGLESIYRTVERYQGSVIVDVTEKEFNLKILLYSQKEKLT